MPRLGGAPPSAGAIVEKIKKNIFFSLFFWWNEKK
jgi:hypothetical protein